MLIVYKRTPIESGSISKRLICLDSLRQKRKVFILNTINENSFFWSISWDSIFFTFKVHEPNVWRALSKIVYSFFNNYDSILKINCSIFQNNLFIFQNQVFHFQNNLLHFQNKLFHFQK